MLDPIVKTIEVPCGQAKAFDIFVRDMGAWWPLDKRSMSMHSGATAKALRVEPQVGGRIVELGDDGSDVLQAHGDRLLQAMALARELQAPVQAVEEADAQVFLQALNLAADRCLGDVQLLGGAGEVEMAGGRLEGDEAGQGGQLRAQANHYLSSSQS